MSTSDDTSTGGAWIGRPLPRYEDLRLVRGAGRYTDDIREKNELRAVVLRSPHAHARIISIDTEAARALPGVHAVLTGADYKAAGLAGMPLMPNPAGALNVDEPVFHDRPDRPIFVSEQWPLAPDIVRFPGEPVAFIVADTLEQARDAAEAVNVDYEILPAVTDMFEAIATGAPVLWDANKDNIAFENEFGEAQAARVAVKSADLVIEQEFRNQRIAVTFMEPRGAVGLYDAGSGSYTLKSGCQGVHRIRMSLCKVFNAEPDAIRVVCPDTGGGFGSRNDPYPEQVLVLWAARVTGRPVRWTNDRTESFLTDYQGRDIVTRARMGFDKDGHITGADFDIYGNVGAQTLSFVQLHNTYRVMPNAYRVPAAALHLRGIITNTTPTGPFRGAGRPEATLAIERCLDMAAASLGIDRLEIRRRNLVTRKEFPYTTASGLIYESGDFHGNMKKAVQTADWKTFERRRRAAAKRGKLAGIGIANYVETPVGAPIERVDVAVTPGVVKLTIGTQSTGQGHETSFAQVMADLFGVTPDDVEIITGDTATVVSGGGTHSDRSMRLGSALMFQASKDIVAQARKVAAHILDVPLREVAFEDGLFVASESNRRLSLFDIAESIDGNVALPDPLRGQLESTASFRGRISAYPTGCAICEVEIDPETGETEITRYTTYDDAGQPINPLILHGQVHGGAVHGIGQALGETMAYDPGSGQVLSASMMDYAMPRADGVPSFDVFLVEDKTKNKANPLRVKGGGEGGTTPGPACVMNAICDALAPLGIKHIDMPATPHRIWRAIQAARD